MSEECPLFRWPTPYLGRRIPKEKFYEHSAVARKVKDRFVHEVERVMWAHRLNSDSVKLDAAEAVPEILVLEVEAKDEDVSEEVLLAIDAVIPHPIIFEVMREENGRREIRMAGVLQLPGKKSSSPRLYSTPWADALSARTPVPTALSLEILYLRILAQIVEVPLRGGEKLTEYRKRVADVERCRREVQRLGRRMGAEKQFNRRVELNGQKKEASRRLGALVTGDTKG